MTVGSTTNRTTGARPSSSTTRNQSTHTVKKGENLWSIARDKSGGRSNAEVSRYHQDLIRANPQIKDPNVVRPGQQLNLPEARTSGPAGTSQTQQAPGADGRSTYQPSSTAAPTQTARPAPAGASPNVAANPALSGEVAARRAGANANPTGRGGAAATATPAEAPAGPIHGRTDLGRRGMPNPNIAGNSVRHSRDRGTDVRSGISRSHDETQRTQNRGAEQSRDTNSQTSETTRGGQRTDQLQEENQIRNRVTGESETERTTVAQDQDGRTGSRTTNSSNAGDTDVDRRNRLRRLAHENGPDPVSGTGVLFDQAIAGDDKYRGVATVDNRHTTDDTGAGYEAHALAYRAQANAAGTVDLRNGEVNVGVNAGVQADVAGVSGRAQAGSRSSMLGQMFAEAEARVGARAEGGAGVVVSPNQVGVRVGAEAFAGAEAKATAGYENRYGGASVTGRAQAGAGAAAGVDIGYDNGNVGVRADLGAALGIGGRITVDVNVNVGAIASDAKSALSEGVSRASRAWSSVNPFD